MSLTSCKACSKQVSTEAKSCPSCGHPVSNGSNARSIILVLLALGAVWIAFDFHQARKRRDADEARYNKVMNDLTGGGRELQAVYDKVATDAVEQYGIAHRQGDAMHICSQAGMVVAAFLQAKDEASYRKWKATEKEDCQRAGVQLAP